QHVDDHLVSGGADQPGEPETTVVNGVKDGTRGRQRVIQAVDIHPHPHFSNAAYQRHSAPPALAIALGAALSCWDAPAPHRWSFNGNRLGKSRGVTATMTRQSHGAPVLGEVDQRLAVQVGSQLYTNSASSYRALQ